MSKHALTPEATEKLKKATDALFPSGQSSEPSAPTFDEWWAIVVTGNMDPRQHHPVWYRLIDTINDEELGVVMNGAVIITPQVTQFFARDFAIIVQPERWQIQTFVRENRSRILEITKTVFKKLFELNTPSFGINAQLHLKTNALDARQAMTKKLLGANLGFPDSSSANCQISWSFASGKHTTSFTVAPSTNSAQSIILGYNQHHVVEQPKELRYFDLAPVLDEVAMNAWKDAEDIGSRITQTMI